MTPISLAYLIRPGSNFRGDRNQRMCISSLDTWMVPSRYNKSSLYRNLSPYYKHTSAHFSESVGRHPNFMHVYARTLLHAVIINLKK